MFFLNSGILVPLYWSADTIQLAAYFLSNYKSYPNVVLNPFLVLHTMQEIDLWAKRYEEICKMWSQFSLDWNTSFPQFLMDFHDLNGILLQKIGQDILVTGKFYDISKELPPLPLYN